jgi:hypothetical protein
VGTAHLGQEIDADGGLVRVVERVVHEACDERCLAHCRGQSALAISRGHVCHVAFQGGMVPTALFAEEDQPVGISMRALDPALAGGHSLELLQRIRVAGLRHCEGGLLERWCAGEEVLVVKGHKATLCRASRRVGAGR